MGKPLKRSTGVKRRKVRGGAVKPSPPSGGRLRAFYVGQGLPSIPVMRDEIQDMVDVLLGREDPPLDAGYLTLMETADAYYARATELTMKILEAEMDGRLPKGSNYSKFRTGELREFREMCKRAADLGSRRLTEEQLRYEMATFGRESKGFRE